MDQLQKTPLYAAHTALGAKMVDFGGWALPVQYASILEEHRAVRERAGLFDVSHMGEIDVAGPDTGKYLEHMLTNEIASLAPGRCRYALLCYPDGGTVDDIIVYKRSEEDCLLVVNAANTGKDFDWLAQNASGYDVALRNVSPAYGQLALQGPKAGEILAPLADAPLPGKRYSFCELSVAGVRALVSRTGYTGEDGYELYCAADDTERLFAALLKAGEPFGILPCGLGARDTLRFEAAMPLYGHELSKEITPLESGLAFAVKPEKGEFIGREALLAPPKRARIGLKLIDRGIARGGEQVLVNGVTAGFTTSGAPSPTLGASYAMAIVGAEYAEASELEIVVRGRALKAEAVPLPFYKTGK